MNQTLTLPFTFNQVLSKSPIASILMDQEYSLLVLIKALLLESRVNYVLCEIMIYSARLDYVSDFFFAVLCLFPWPNSLLDSLEKDILQSLGLPLCLFSFHQTPSVKMS